MLIRAKVSSRSQSKVVVALSSFMLACVVGSLVGVTGKALAGYWAFEFNTNCTWLRSGADAPASGWDRDSSGFGFFNCPIADTSALPKETLTGINVWGRDNSSTMNAVASVCVKFYNAPGFSCGADDNTTNAFVGYFLLNPPLTAIYNTPSGYAYMTVRIPGGCSANPSCQSFVSGYDGTDE